MKYKDRDELVADLREFADFIEAHGHKLPIDQWYPLTLNQYVYDESNNNRGTIKDQMVKAARNLGYAEKVYTDSYFRLKKEMSNKKVALTFEASRQSVCTKKVVGTEKVPKKRYVEIPNEYDEKEIVEWECDPLLS